MRISAQRFLQKDFAFSLPNLSFSMTRLHCSLRFTPNLTGYTRGSPCSKKPLETACKCLLKIYADQYELILPPKVIFCVFMVHFFFSSSQKLMLMLIFLRFLHCSSSLNVSTLSFPFHKMKISDVVVVWGYELIWNDVYFHTNAIQSTHNYN